jgi:hypothetical protein
VIRSIVETLNGWIERNHFTRSIGDAAANFASRLIRRSCKDKTHAPTYVSVPYQDVQES